MLELLWQLYPREPKNGNNPLLTNGGLDKLPVVCFCHGTVLSLEQEN